MKIRKTIGLDLFLGVSTGPSYGMLRFDLQEKKLLPNWLLSGAAMYIVFPSDGA